MIPEGTDAVIRLIACVAIVFVAVLALAGVYLLGEVFR